MNEPMLTCEQVLERILDFIDRELTADERRRLERHLQTCRSCFSRVEFERRLKTRLTDLAREDAPASMRERVTRLIDGF